MVFIFVVILSGFGIKVVLASLIELESFVVSPPPPFYFGVFLFSQDFPELDQWNIQLFRSGGFV